MVYWEKYTPYSQIEFKPAPRDESTRGAAYADCIGAFDIETSRFTDIEQSAMYVWQFCLDFSDGHDIVIMGRTWEEFTHCLLALKQRLKGLKLIVYIHNASYEFQFISGIYKFKDEEVFILEGRSILYFYMYYVFDFRCSYKLFNMSLSMATGKYAPAYHKKDGGNFDYKEIRYWDTPLTHKQLLYCLYDVWGLCKAIRGLMALYNDNVYTIPYTATGFVRREIKEAMQPYHHKLCDLWPDWDCFELLRLAFRGGNTHANRFYAGEILHDMDSMDISSSYPAQECTQLYPMKPFKRRVERTEKQVRRYIERGAAVLLYCRLTNVELKYRYTPIPYLALAKCVKYPLGAMLDNGRILACKECDIVITDIDLSIIDEMYNYKMEVLDYYTSWYDYLPFETREINKKYYRLKTELKGIDGQELYYMKAKNQLNAIYGDFVMNPCRLKILYAAGLFETDKSKTPAEVLERNGKRPHRVYQWGVWCTAHARRMLQDGINIAGVDRVVYVDTDSVKYFGKADFSEYNANRQEIALKEGCFADDKHGTRHYMGVYEFDGHYQDFITQGAKKYAYSTDKSGPYITVAGVPKKTGAVELLYKGGLPSFKPGFVWNETGKLESVYNDIAPGRMIIDGHKVNFTKNIVLRETTYKLDVTGDYADILSSSEQLLDAVHEFWRKSQLN